jgi:hypothetical protein
LTSTPPNGAPVNRGGGGRGGRQDERPPDHGFVVDSVNVTAAL